MNLAWLFPVAFAFGTLATAGDAAALGVGRVQGTPLIGRPLEVSVPVTLDAASESLPECIEADVYYGDARLPRTRVTTQTQRVPEGAVLRVRAEPAVNEPVVTVYVQLGCTNRFTRRVVLFSEQPDPEADRLAEARAARQALPALAPAAPASAAAPAAPAAPAPTARRNRPAVVEGRGAPSTAQASPRAAAPAAASRAARRGDDNRGTPQARLKLEPMDSSAVDPKLRVTPGLSDPAATGNQQQRALAAAIWKALNAQPEDLLRDMQRLQALEDSTRSLRQAVQRNEAALAEVRTQLEQAQRERYANPVVYLLALLAVLGIVAALWFRRRSREPAAQWWSGTASQLDADDASTQEQLRVDPRDEWKWSARPDADKPASAAQREQLAREQPLVEADAVAPDPAAQPHRPHPTGFSSSLSSEFQTSMLGSRTLKAEELHDVQQEADFFVSLGEYDRAVDVLRSHIASNPETSAVAWLDLMDIFHTLGRRAEYDGIRREFQSLFNAQVPEYDHYSEAVPSLEDYPGAIQRICALWPHPRVLEVIEESIFRGPQHEDTQAFSLEAYRDLLMLHHIGTEALLDPDGDDAVRLPFAGAAPADTGPPVTNFAATSISPLSAGGRTLPATTGAGAQASLDPLPSLGVDIDLDQLGTDEPASGIVPLGSSTGGAVDDGNVLDFDLPDIDTSAYTTKKTRE